MRIRLRYHPDDAALQNTVLQRFLHAILILAPVFFRGQKGMRGMNWKIEQRDC
jgi:hypothetical protein